MSVTNPHVLPYFPGTLASYFGFSYSSCSSRCCCRISALFNLFWMLMSYGSTYHKQILVRCACGGLFDRFLLWHRFLVIQSSSHFCQISMVKTTCLACFQFDWIHETSKCLKEKYMLQKTHVFLFTPVMQA